MSQRLGKDHPHQCGVLGRCHVGIPVAGAGVEHVLIRHEVVIVVEGLLLVRQLDNVTAHPILSPECLNRAIG